ncbi:ClcB-like voltage-gated chloride channel protein [Paucibacter sp. R3-3]|uniref:ClcB-like voltage-gated chloride channel protein n=1 Tax=Roseateles agri TaxID=3098619 RepID=A0ABU5DSY5_9BURK|nr:ClcB-like voltage-gated chloride channel protein [Paucibacter sp. R3-3]MDY0748890.1 ClcB-like voltage-gated chloride channel protein [Paucibacter sp. R3-3]
MRSFVDFRLLALRRLRATEWEGTLLWAALIGVLGALATIGFREGLLATERLLYGRSDGLVQIARGLPEWLRLLAPALGGLVAGAVLLAARRMPLAQGGDYMEAIALGEGRLGLRWSCLRALSSAATVVSGGAIGREGPMVQLAALAGSLIGSWRAVPVPRRRLMVACGAAAGVATAYNAPIAGALFVAEIVLRSLAMESLGPLLVAAFAANVTAGLLVDAAPVYRMPAFVAPHGAPMVLLASVGLLAGFGAPLFLGLLDGANALFKRIPLALPLKLGLGGLGVGALSLAAPQVWGNGYSVVNAVLQGDWLWTALLAVLALKLLAVASTTGSGAVGGIFTPTLFVGAISGALFAIAAERLWPGAVPAPAAIAVGMGAFLAACTHAPLMSVLMIFEMTENYGVVVPLMLACVLGYSISRRLRPRSIYAGVPELNAHAPALTMAADLLRTDSATVRVGDSLAALEAAFVRWRRPHIYVLDAEDRFAGAIALHDLAPLVKQGTAADAPWPAALLRSNFPRVELGTPVWKVLEVFATHPGERLPVLDAAGRLAGYVTKTDLVLMLRERLAVG